MTTKPLTALALPQVFGHFELNERRNLAKKIPALRPIFERTRPPTFQKVSFGYTEGKHLGRERCFLTCCVDGKEWKQLPDQSDADFFAVIQQNVMKKEHRIAEIVIEPRELNWHPRISNFTELPIVKKFTVSGSIMRQLPLFQGLHCTEAYCYVGAPSSLCLDPMRTARKLEVHMMHGNPRSMKALRNCAATHWTVNTFGVPKGANDWIRDKFASGNMEIGSKYREQRNNSSRDFFVGLVEKYPKTVSIEDKEFFLDLNNGTELFSWIEGYARDCSFVNMEIIRKSID